MINVTRSSMPDYDEYCKEIKELWDSHWLTNMGAKHNELEAELKKYLNAPNVMLYTNGHLALENAIAAMGLSGDVITTPFTFVSTTHSIVRCGLNPVFCDINATDYTIDADKIEALITDRTTAIVPVHVYGNLCDVEKIQKIADKYKLKVIYDAAHAFGVEYKGVSSANFGDAAMFSFHATKVFNTIEGGAVTYKDSALTQKLISLRNFGIRDQETIEFCGGNAKMNEFQAAMGICNLRHLNDEIAKRANVVAQYRERLSGISGITLCADAKDTKPNYAYFPVIFDGYKYNRDELFEKLRENGITARKYFYPLTNSCLCYAGRPGFEAERTPVAAHIATHVLTLPLYADLSVDDVDRICSIIVE